MEIDFSKTNPEGAAPAPVMDSPTVPTENMSVPATVPQNGGGLVLGDRLPSFREIILPRLNLTQNIGKLKESFEPGSLIFNQQVCLFVPQKVNAATGNVTRSASPPVNLAVLGFRPTRYCEKVAGGARGLIVNTEDEVRRAGGTLDYQEWELKKASGMKRFEQLADALVAIKRPECVADDDTVFVYDVEGVKYALALWALRGVQYTAAAKKVFFTQRSIGCLRAGGYPSYHFAVTTREETYQGGNKAWIPICLAVGKSSPAFLDFVKGVLTSPEATNTPAEEPAF